MRVVNTGYGSENDYFRGQDNRPFMSTPTPFDRIATSYDDDFTNSAVGQLQREVVRRFLKKYTRTGANILELNCGTGEDALWLARQGCLVLATDIAPAMVARAAEKARQASQQDRIATQVLDIRTLATDTVGPNTPERRFDLVLSNFGGLNCLSADAIARLGMAMPALLHPGSVFVAVVMGRFCWWETVYFLLKGQWREAFRRSSRQAVLARLNAETTVPTWYYSPRQFHDLFPGWRVLHIEPVGIWLPPSYLDSWFSRWPRCLRFFYFFEKKCRASVWAGAADHFLIAMTPA